jgi:hypothetical protein
MTGQESCDHIGRARKIGNLEVFDRSDFVALYQREASVGTPNVCQKNSISSG